MPAPPLHPSGIDILPLEIKSRIASHATIDDTKRLARVSHSWQIAAESHLYERIGFQGKHHPSTYTWESDVEDSFWNYEHQWVKVLEALRARPARARYVRVVQAYAFRENASHVKRILRLCHRNLVDILHQIEWTENCHGEEIETRKDSWLSRAVIRANKPFFNLTSLDLKLASSPFDILLDILQLTPNLERLRVRGQGWWQTKTEDDALNDDGEEAGEENVPLKLERLREVMLGFWEDAQAMEAIVTAAPRLAVSRFSSLGCLGEGMAHPATFWRSQTLRHVACIAEAVEPQNRDRKDEALLFLAADLWRGALAENFFPSAESLVLSIDSGPGHLGGHRSLEFLGLILQATYFDSGLKVPYRLGTGPSRTVSGLLARWIVEALDGMPKLLRLAHDVRWEWILCSWADAPAPWWTKYEFGMSIRSYTDGIDTFYHAKYTGGDEELEEYLLGPHFWSYTSVNMKWTEFSSVGQPWRFGGPSSVVDLTYYRGYPVPFALPEHIYDLNNETLDWQVPGRDMALVVEAWSLLRGWWSEVERDKAQRGDDDVRAHLTESDLEDIEFGLCVLEAAGPS